ncbi:SDR family NAD(P)-dependent oxidoreductase [Rhizobium halophytocola]|uniref:3-oxoacyl-[acyl-carrier protein] reductase n=1 Tax=Rhizobium halophytocola TaxID=735519 RepID=A0ABS4E3C5_9HYPH|nr:SDR family oxidoreductase [Rhizobium halophytocola]MBP1852438.1 3-oxoacyl-[acyl-carrier protein] reductase [Rhizobium halophytocola]
MSDHPTFPDLAGKAVLITGASSGIGAALAYGFAAQGALVGLHYNANAEAAHAIARDIEETGGSVMLVQADAAESDAMRQAVDKIAKTFGRLDGLINNAGSMIARVLYGEMTDDHYDRVMDVNARSVVSTTQAALPHLKKQGGFVINTTSVAARSGGTAGSGLYGSSKAFVGAVTKGMALEFAQYGIRVNAVAPGVIETPFQEKYALPGQLDQIAASVPLKRTGTPADCLGAYLFLASQAMSGYITGQTIDVNGGQLMP